MNLNQMQMTYDVTPNGKVVLVNERIDFRNHCQPRVAQGQNRAAKGDYRPRFMRPLHDTSWKVG